MMRCFAGSLALFCLCGCTGTAPAVSGDGETLCMYPRPQVCTMEYDPVCATLAEGIRATYSNACSACADSGVTSHIPGVCE